MPSVSKEGTKKKANKGSTQKTPPMRAPFKTPTSRSVKLEETPEPSGPSGERKSERARKRKVDDDFWTDPKGK